MFYNFEEKIKDQSPRTLLGGPILDDGNLSFSELASNILLYHS